MLNFLLLFSTYPHDTYNDNHCNRPDINCIYYHHSQPCQTQSNETVLFIAAGLKSMAMANQDGRKADLLFQRKMPINWWSYQKSRKNRTLRKKLLPGIVKIILTVDEIIQDLSQALPRIKRRQRRHIRPASICDPHTYSHTGNEKNIHSDHRFQ